VLAQAPWAGKFHPLEGLILHEAEAGQMTSSKRSFVEV
jgi:hypothetical protein